jgi:hypothetical protein
VKPLGHARKPGNENKRKKRNANTNKKWEKDLMQNKSVFVAWQLMPLGCVS